MCQTDGSARQCEAFESALTCTNLLGCRTAAKRLQKRAAKTRSRNMQFAVGHPRSKTLVTFTTHLLSRRRKAFDVDGAISQQRSRIGRFLGSHDCARLGSGYAGSLNYRIGDYCRRRCCTTTAELGTPDEDRIHITKGFATSLHMCVCVGLPTTAAGSRKTRTTPRNSLGGKIFSPSCLHQPCTSHHQRPAKPSHGAVRIFCTCSTVTRGNSHVHAHARRPAHRNKKAHAKPAQTSLAALRRLAEWGRPQFVLRGFYSMQQTHVLFDTRARRRRATCGGLGLFGRRRSDRRRRDQ